MNQPKTSTVPFDGCPAVWSPGPVSTQLRASPRASRQRTHRFGLSGPWPAFVGALVVALGVVALSKGFSGTTTSVVDHAALLDEPERRAITDYHQRLLTSFDIDYRVVLAADADDLEAYGDRRMVELGVGQASANRRGLLLAIDPVGHRVGLEVAAGLEGIFSAPFTEYLEQRQMAPYFERDRVAEGIIATSELIFARAQQAAAGFAFDRATAESYGLGGGALAAARLGAPPDALSTPTGTVDAYLAALAAQDMRPDLALYSRTTRAMLAGSKVTPAQMGQIAAAYGTCAERETWIGPDSERAVVRFRAEQRQCAPFFLVREDGAWRLDLAPSQRALAFDHLHQWRLAERDAAGYGFAFEDWRFDRDGLPLANS